MKVTDRRPSNGGPATAMVATVIPAAENRLDQKKIVYPNFAVEGAWEPAV